MPVQRYTAMATLSSIIYHDTNKTRTTATLPLDTTPLALDLLTLPAPPSPSPSSRWEPVTEAAVATSESASVYTTVTSHSNVLLLVRTTRSGTVRLAASRSRCCREACWMRRMALKLLENATGVTPRPTRQRQHAHIGASSATLSTIPARARQTPQHAQLHIQTTEVTPSNTATHRQAHLRTCAALLTSSPLTPSSPPAPLFPFLLKRTIHFGSPVASLVGHH